jgi:hypothetical protein
VTLAFRASSFVSAGNASGSTLNFAKPVGLADGDVIVYVVYCEPDTNTVQIVLTGTSTDAGFTSLFKEANTGAFFTQVFAKLAASEPTTYDLKITTTPNWRTIVGGAYSGGTGTGALLDLANGAQADAVVTTSQTAPSIITTVANDMVIYGYGNFSSTNIVTMSGFCTNVRGSVGGVALTDAVKTTAGATGTSNPLTGPGTETYAAIHAAIISDTGGAATIPSLHMKPTQMMPLGW